MSDDWEDLLDIDAEDCDEPQCPIHEANHELGSLACELRSAENLLHREED